MSNILFADDTFNLAAFVEPVNKINRGRYLVVPTFPFGSESWIRANDLRVVDPINCNNHNQIAQNSTV